MHSYILTYPSNQSDAVFTKILELTNLGFSKAAFFSHADIIHINQSKQSLKIETVRNLKETLTRNPFQLPIQLAVIWEAHLLTPPAQHALLKLLEEPGEKTKLFLVTQHYQQLLPTILSRCQVVRDRFQESQKVQSSKFKVQSYENTKTQITQRQRDAEMNTNHGEETVGTSIIDLPNLSNLSPTERMVKLEEYAKDKDKALQWLEAVIQNIHLAFNLQSSIFNLPISSLTIILNRAQMAYNDLNANINVKLAMDQLAIHWSEELDE